MEKQLKKRYFNYLVSHYGRMSDASVRKLLEKALLRLTLAKVYPADVLEKVIEDMVEEGNSVSKILAHVDMLDIENRI
tara:strand:- start:7152 stop:7385 length:234 start_codon:yes stop_codon:yes gene_type:complete